MVITEDDVTDEYTNTENDSEFYEDLSFNKFKISNLFRKRIKKEDVAIGLDIGASSIKIAVLKKERNEITLVKWRIYEFDINYSDIEKKENMQHAIFDFYKKQEVN